MCSLGRGGWGQPSGSEKFFGFFPLYSGRPGLAGAAPDGAGGGGRGGECVRGGDGWGRDEGEK
jgi:hypothetical protein